MNVPRTDQAMVMLPDGTVLVAGEQFYDPSSAEIYEPATGTFSPTGSMPVGGYGQRGAVLPDGTVLLAGDGTSSIYHPNQLIPAPGLFTLTGTESGQGAIWNALTGQAASSQTPATAGDVLSMYTTSLIEGGVMPPRVILGGVLAPVLFFGDAPGYPGYFQVNFQVPGGVAAGSTVPVCLTYFGRSSNPVSIAVH